ncbi:hypothetical protein Hypma_011309 [Hypsizygus marmoreus]|uniref:Uncharacterized protein n=1 Tax=Hypsizygus marmoreus TaxID=39966 RepID=A0A369JK96_HYPMA|nr:hypothetical protein Hypma_011309 [Hypsizygus marmoreus]
MSPQIHLEVPASTVFLYSRRSCESLGAPLSPTSSIKGCFVRSRPTSVVFSEYEFSQFPGTDRSNGCPSPITNEDENGHTSPMINAVIDATERQANVGQSDTRSLAPSTRSRMRIVRRSDADIDEEIAKLLREMLEVQAQGKKETNSKDGDKAVVKKAVTGTGARRRTWTSYKVIRKTLSSILHRKETHAASVATTTGDADTPEPPVERLKPSSASLFSRRRRTTVSSGGETPKGTKLGQRARAHTDAVRPALRRSRSFSGFTNVLSIINDDDDLDEATTEASGLVEAIRHRWAFEEVPEADSGSPIRFDMEVFEHFLP